MPYFSAFPFRRTLNFGLLALATYLKDCGREVEIVDPQLDPSRFDDQYITHLVAAASPKLIGLSCISGYSYPACLRMAESIRGVVPEALIVVGGQDHVGRIPENVLRECQAIDVVVSGEGENTIEALIRSVDGGIALGQIPNIAYRDRCSGRTIVTEKDSKTAELPPRELCHQLYPGYHLYPPSIELSRGCPHRCEFCSSARSRVDKRPVEDVVHEAAELCRLHDNSRLRIYFEAPLLTLNNTDLRKLAQLRNAIPQKFTWRTEVRVDSLSPEYLRACKDAGAAIFDLGLESAAPKILRAMRKTTRPNQYLSSASQSLKSAHAVGLMTKVNVLFYLGESQETLCETFDFLCAHARFITSLSAYPVLAYPGSSLSENLDARLAEVGGRRATGDRWKAMHLTPVDPSAELTWPAMQHLGILFGKAFQTLEEYFEQKMYGYFSPQTTLENFRDGVKCYGLHHLPFSLCQKEMLSWRSLLREALRNRSLNEYITRNPGSLLDGIDGKNGGYLGGNEE